VFHVLIPARYRSERLPGKALIEIAGKPMVCHVYDRALMSGAATVTVATDDERIAEAVKANGGKACMTSAAHPSGTDRLHEAARILGLQDEDVVINVQGDEPLIPPEAIDQLANNLVESGAPMATLCEPIEDFADVADPNVVKVVMDQSGRAIYFSRAPIPFDRDQSGRAEGCYRHLGIYAYRVSMLADFVSWAPAPIEQAEKLEQLRVLWHGLDIHVGVSPVAIPPGIDTEQDLERARAIMEQSNG
jgi:3-deoxy-manno-octulosonate cytidylyltransferase (CMP-KDO synthetase)